MSRTCTGHVQGMSEDKLTSDTQYENEEQSHTQYCQKVIGTVTLKFIFVHYCLPIR